MAADDGNKIMSVSRLRVARPDMAAVGCVCVCTSGAVVRCQRGPIMVGTVGGESERGRRGGGELSSASPRHAAHRISDMSEHLDPLAYVLLFPSGDPGWHANLKHKQLPSEMLSAADQQRYTRISPEQFYRRRLMVFDLEDKASILPHAGGLLFQQ